MIPQVPLQHISKDMSVYECIRACIKYTYIYIYIYIYVSSTNCGNSVVGVSKCPVCFPSRAESCSEHLQDELSVVKSQKKARRKVVFLLYNSLVPPCSLQRYGNRSSHGWMIGDLSHPWPKSTGYDPPFAWLMSPWYSQLAVIHPIPSKFYMPLLNVSTVLLLFESVWIHHFLTHT